MSKVEKEILANEVAVVGDELVFKVAGKAYQIELSAVSEKLRRANKVERSFFQVSASGYGVHWPLIDEDISFKGLLRDIER